MEGRVRMVLFDISLGLFADLIEASSRATVDSLKSYRRIVGYLRMGRNFVSD
jgi:hypothetical protein